jgi:hypothetical protein
MPFPVTVLSVILKLKPDHGHAQLEDLLNSVSICSRIGDYPHPQEAHLVLDELDIPYLIVERAVVQVPMPWTSA